MEKFGVYAHGLVCCSVCSNLGEEETIRMANIKNPTGIQSRWTLAPESFVDGSKNPHQCENDPDCLHYLLMC